MMATDGPVVRVIVLNFNSGRYLSKCLAALARQDFRRFEADLVDNGSTDGSLREALPDDPRFLPMLLGENVGFGAANNRAALSAATPFIALLNPDTFPERNWLSALLAAGEHHPDIAMFGSTQLDAMAPDRFDGIGDIFLFGDIFDFRRLKKTWFRSGAPHATVPARWYAWPPSQPTLLMMIFNHRRCSAPVTGQSQTVDTPA